MNDEHMEWVAEAPVLAALHERSRKSTHGFLVPAAYFNTLKVQTEAQIALEKVRTASASNGFSTPDAYFSKLQAGILAQTINAAPQPKKLRLWHNDWVKYVSAACFVLLVATGLYLKQQSALKADQYAELASDAVLYNIDESVIIEHLKEDQKATHTVSQTEMENYILDHYSANELTNSL